MKTSEQGLNLIKKWESLQLKSYICPSGKWTIGYGHTGSDVIQNATITEQQANDLLIHDIKPIENVLNLGINRTLDQNQFDALVSFIFNCGMGAFNASTLKQKILKNPKDVTIHAEFLKWKYGTRNGVKVVMQGLLNRRREEAALYFKDIVKV